MIHASRCGPRGSCWGRGCIRADPDARRNLRDDHLREGIHVYKASDDLRADHVLTLFGTTFLRLHYRLRLRAASQAAGFPAAMETVRT